MLPCLAVGSQNHPSSKLILQGPCTSGDRTSVFHSFSMTVIFDIMEGLAEQMRSAGLVRM